MSPVRTLPRLAYPVWGGSTLAARYGKGGDPAARIGESWEIWWENPTFDGRRLGDVADLPLLIKLLDVRERLSVQVHPDDVAARRIDGAPVGKSEGWVVLHAEPDARVALGLVRELSREELRDSAVSGAIEAELAWRTVAAGDVIDVPAGTIHAIDGGVLLYEVQQPSDLTYRLYDWGRGRPLRLDDAVAVARRRPATPVPPATTLGPGRALLLSTPHFVLERAVFRGAGDPSLRTLSGCEAVTVIDGALRIGEESLVAGESAVLPPGGWAISGEGVALFARPGPGTGVNRGD